MVSVAEMTLEGSGIGLIVLVGPYQELGFYLWVNGRV